MDIPLDLIAPSPHPIRSSWDEDKMAELARSVREQGVIVPIKVRPADDLPCDCAFHGYRTLTDEPPPPNEGGGDDHIGECHFCNEILEWIWPEYTDDEGYTITSFDQQWDQIPPKRLPFEIVYGHRRVEAARRAGLSDIPTTVEGLDDDDAQWQAFIENVQREDLTALEIANACAERKSADYSNDEIAARVGWSSGRMVENYLAMVNAASPVQQVLDRHPGISQHVFSRSGAAGLSRQPIVRASILEKSAKERLTDEQTRQVAESVAAAGSQKRRQYLIDHPYSPYTHDPAYQRQREQQYGDHDPLFSGKPDRPASQDWHELPSVKQSIDTIKWWHETLKDMRKMADLGKMAPEARRFIAHRLRTFVNEVQEFIDELNE